MTAKPFSLLVKPASADCNLRCEYCFYIDRLGLYPHTKVHRMSDEVLEQMISTFMATRQPQYAFGWQGGEPTLMGLDFFKRVVELQQKYARQGTRVANGLQTNATLIDDEFAAFLAKYNFLVGVSLDGPPQIHDKYRQTPGGNGTHKDVMRGIECLKRNNVEFNILTLVNHANVGRGAEVYRYLRDLGFMYHQYIPCVEFDQKGNKAPFAITGEEWGDFLCQLFDEWYKEDTRKVSIRLFDSIVSLLVDGVYTTCHLAGNCCHYLVVEYNGDVYPCDFFVESQRKLGSVLSDSWDDMLKSRDYIGFGQLKNQWSDRCFHCEYLDYCSGDCLKHRLYAEGGPERISWLCSGWKQFYKHTLPRFKELAVSILKERVAYGMITKKDNYDLLPDRSIGRNEPCFCGSSKKYKKCHGML